MARYGEYESVREVYRGGLAVVYTARPPGGGEDRLALKVLELPVYLADEERVEQESVLFLESAETQRRAAAGSPAWAPVHASGRCEGGAWYATDLFERSAEKLVLHRRDLEPAEVHRVVAAAVEGLQALRQIEGRPHGNLKTTNILISGRGEVASARVALADPIATSRIKPDEDSVKDLKDLGDLLHQLVLHRPMRSAMAWPLSMTPEWQRLGRVGAGWLELCNALLNPTAAPPSLDEVAAFLPELAGGSGTGSAAVAAGATPAPTPQAPPGSAPTARPDFSKSRPASGVEGAPLRDSGAGVALATPPGSAPALEPGSGATPITPGSHPGSGAPSRPGLGRWKDQEAGALPEKGLPQKSKLKLYAGAGLAAVAVVVGAAVFFSGGDKKADPPPVRENKETRPAPAFTEPDPRDVAFRQLVEETSESAIEIRDLLKETAPEIDLTNLNATITSFDADRGALGALAWNRDTRDTVLAGVDRLRTAARRVQELTQSFGSRSPDPRVTARQEADAVMASARSVRAALESDAGAVRQIDELLERIRTQFDVTDPKKLAWKPGQENKQARAYAESLRESVAGATARIGEIFESVPDPRSGGERAGVEAAVAEARETAEALNALKKPSAELEREVTALAGALGNLDSATVPWTLENVAAVRDSVALVRKSADTVLKTAREAWAQNAADPRPAARAEAEAVFPALESAAQQAGAALTAIPKVSGLSEAQRNELASSINASLSALNAARDSVRAAVDGAATPEWGVRAAAEAQGQVERIAAATAGAGKARDELLALMKNNEQVMAAAVQEHRKALVEESRAIVAALNSGFTHADEVNGATLAERLARLEADSEFAAVSADGSVTEAARRLKQLTTIASSADAPALLGELRDASAKGLVAEGCLALARLTAPELKYAPASAQDLGAAAGAVAQLRDALGRVPDTARGAELAARAADAGGALWRAYLERLDFSRGADVKIARDVMPALGLKDADLARLGARERFNFMLMDLRAGLESADDAAARAAVEKFRAASGSLDGAARGPAEAAVTALDQAVNVSEPAAPPPPDFSKLGPGVRGWAAEEGKIGGVDTVTYRKGGQTLVFARATEDTMVGATEVSFAQFVGAVNDAGRWPDVSRLLPSRNVENDGPRVWIWSVTDDRIELALPIPGGYSKGWLPERPSKIRAVYPAALADGVTPPEPSMPMQFVSAGAAVYAAALLGCRLPTAQEWGEALRVESAASGAGPAANRRDATWEQVKSFGLDQAQAPGNQSLSPNWPDDGIFLPRGFPPSLVGPKALPAVNEPDGTLWFLPVDQGGGTVFRHLVGNVAEFVYEKPSEIEGMDPTYDTVVGKLGSNTDKATLVIGASALSPPELAPASPAESRFSRSNPAVAAKSDVGFRLAFTSKSGPPRPKPLPERVRDAAGTLAFLPPK